MSILNVELFLNYSLHSFYLSLYQELYHNNFYNHTYMYVYNLLSIGDTIIRK